MKKIIRPAAIGLILVASSLLFISCSVSKEGDKGSVAVNTPENPLGGVSKSKRKNVTKAAKITPTPVKDDSVNLNDPTIEYDKKDSESDSRKTENGTKEPKPGTDEFRALLGDYERLTDMWDITWGHVVISADPDDLRSCVACASDYIYASTKLTAYSDRLAEFAVNYDWDRTGDVYVNISPADNPELCVTTGRKCIDGIMASLAKADGSDEQTFTFVECGDYYYLRSETGMYLTEVKGYLFVTSDAEKATAFGFVRANIEADEE